MLKFSRRKTISPGSLPSQELLGMTSKKTPMAANTEPKMMNISPRLLNSNTFHMLLEIPESS